MAELIENIDDVIQNIYTLSKYASGSEKEQKFHYDRIKNGKWFIAYKNEGNILFSPSKFAGYKNNNTEHEYDLENRSGTDTNKRFAKVIGSHLDVGDQGYEEVDNAFMGYCHKHNIEPSKHKQSRRYWLINSDATIAAGGNNLILSLARQINLSAYNHPIGELQKIRAELKGLSRQPGSDIFSSQTAKGNWDWAFHHGGRSELQFNIGIEYVEGLQMVRHGVAFSFGLSQTLPTIDPLITKVRFFNEFLRLYPDLFSDMRMWHYKKGEKSSDYIPAPIPPENATEGAFIFLGKRQPSTDINKEVILNDFDRMLPLYKYVESNGSLQPISTTSKENFVFRAGCSAKVSTTKSTFAERQLDLNLRHNVLQEALYNILAAEFGHENVATENPSGTGNKVDVIVRNKAEYWFYEIKTSQSPKACIREAIGQLLEYSYWPGSQIASRLIICGESELDQETSTYLRRLQKHFNLPIFYQQIITKTNSEN